MRFLGLRIDERFLAHRRRSTSIAGQAAVTLAICLFAWRFYIDHIWSWDLLAVGLTAVLVKLSVMLWSILKE
jgi:hypothetical protein